eukprot:756197-Hanusia_phi.AAC.3
MGKNLIQGHVPRFRQLCDLTRNKQENEFMLVTNLLLPLAELPLKFRADNKPTSHIQELPVSHSLPSLIRLIQLFTSLSLLLFVMLSDSLPMLDLARELLCRNMSNNRDAATRARILKLSSVQLIHPSPPSHGRTCFARTGPSRHAICVCADEVEDDDMGR